MGVDLELSDGACLVGFDVARPLGDWPIWPWITEGAQFDISLWDTGEDLRGGDSLWMVLRDSTTGAPLMSIYQFGGELIENGQFREELGVDASIVGPVCESSALGGGVLVHAYELRFSSQGRITLGQSLEGSLPASNAPLSWKIQTGVLANTMGHLLDPNGSVFGVRYGEYFQFVAWTEPR